jgi:hypothetical protein
VKDDSFEARCLTVLGFCSSVTRAVDALHDEVEALLKEYERRPPPAAVTRTKSSAKLTVVG